MLKHVNGSSNPLHWFNLTRSLHDLLALPQISSCQTTYLWLPGSHSLACPAPPRPSSVIICTTLAQIPHDSSVPWHTLIAPPPALLAVNPQLISFFPTGTISLSVSQLPPSPSTPLISLQPPAKWIMRSISPPRPPGLFHSLCAQPASPPLPAATRLRTPPASSTYNVEANSFQRSCSRSAYAEKSFWLPGYFLIMKPIEHVQLCHFPPCLCNLRDGIFRPLKKTFKKKRKKD